MIQFLAEVPWWLFVAFGGLGLLLLALHILASQDGFMAGQRAAEDRNRDQQKFDYERGRVDGVRETLDHLRDTGQLPPFLPTRRQPPKP